MQLNGREKPSGIVYGIEAEVSDASPNLNLSNLKGCLLKHCPHMPGVNTPYLYTGTGCLFYMNNKSTELINVRDPILYVRWSHGGRRSRGYQLHYAWRSQVSVMNAAFNIWVAAVSV